MNKKNSIIGLVAIALFVSGVFVGIASPIFVDTDTKIPRHMGMHKEKRVEYAERVQERGVIQNAIEKGDYEAWKEAMGDRPNAAEVTQEEFVKLQEAHTLAQEGKYDEARQIRESIGISDRGNGQGKRCR